MPSLLPDLRLVIKETDRLIALSDSWDNVIPIHRKFLAEIVIVRLAILIENFSKSLFCKLSCGAVYLDGTAPIVLAGQRSTSAAITAMQTLGRTKPRNLKWNDGKEIRRNIENILDKSDPAARSISNYSSFFTEVKYIRNHVVHRSDSTRRNFKSVLIKYYGAAVPSITCGALLLTSRVGPPCLLRTYIVSARVMAKELTRG
jgi:hypothetical protein